MKRLLSLAVIAILISLPLAHAVNVSGTISSNVTWTEADSPYTVDGDVTIATNGWLGIEPGVEVRFNQNRVLAVRGGLVAQGTAGAPIRFIGATQTNDWWYGVDVLGTGSVAAVHCEFAHAGSGSGYAAIRKQGTGALSVSDSKFHHNGDQALYLYPGSSFLDLGHNSFSNNNIGVRIAVNGSLEDVTSTFLANAYDVVVDGGTLTQPVSWRLGPDYSMYVNSVTVATNGSLLVSPGTVLKFPSAGYILVNGRMEATGTPAEPIFFTDWRDDAAGGDANHDGSATSPATGWWRAIRCLGTGSVSLAYGTIRYAGQSDSRAVEISVSGAVALSHCLIGQNTGYGVYLASTNGRADLADCTIQSNSLSGIYLNGGSLSATGCAVRGNAEYGLLHEINDTTPYAWSSYAGNGIAAIGIKGVTMTRAVTWTRPRESETLRIIDNVLIASNASLTIDPGVVVEFSKGRWLDVYGGLRAEGAESNRVVLTGSAQSNNWWRGLELYETGSVVLAFADLSYAGETYPYLGINKQGGASLAMSNCSLHHINGIALLLRNAPGSLSLHNTWFSNNTFAVQLDPGASIDDATSRFTNNTYDVYHNSGTITQQVSWRLPRDCSLHAAGVTVATNGALTVGAGTVVKFASGAWLDVHGRLEATGTPDEPVCFTDWRDDTVGGDANHDGNSTAPAAGWWRAIRGYGTGSVSLARSTVRYAGQSDGRAIYRTGSGELKLAGCVIANNNGDGVQIDGAAGPVAITGCEFSGNNNGVRALNQSNDFAIARSAIFSNATYGVTNAGPATVDARGAWWGAASGPHHPSLNPSGAGDKVGNLVQFDPWRTNSDPLVVQCDLTVTDGTAPADGVFGALVQISWVVNNGGEQNTHALWKDRIYLSAMSNSLAGAVPLLAADNVNALAVGARYTNTQSAALPLSTNSIAGNYYLVVKVDAFDDVFEEEEKNNLRAWPIALSLPSLPDLEVARIVAPAHASAGDAISLSWTVTNNGATLASGPWRQSIYLSRDALVGGDQFLTNVAFSGSLMPASGWVCTQELVVSKSGPVGALYFVVETDSRGDVVEGNESNNVTLADAPMQVEAQLTLSRTVASILENSANSNVTITATRNGDLGTALTVLTESSNPAKLSVPASAIIPAGQASTTFKATVQRDGVYDADAVVAIIASSASYLSATTSITVVNVDAPQLGLALASGQLTEGISTTGTLVRPSGMTSSVVVALGNSIPGQVLVPAAVSLLPFQTSTTFEVQALDDNLVERTNTYTIKAGTPGYGSASNNLMVVDNDLPVVRLQLSEGAVSEGADSVALRGMASRDRTSTQPLSLSLTSSDTTAARVPARIIIPAMQTSVVFNVTVINDDLVDGPQTTEIGGAILETATGMPVGEIIPVALEVTDNDGPTLRLFLAHEVVGEGLDPATTATVFRNADPGGALSVSLASSDASEATVPASIVIPAGSNSAAFSIATLDDGVADGNQSVDLLASAEGYTGGTALLTVSDADQPDLAVQEVATPSGALTEEPFLVTFRIRNQGRAATTNGFAVRICRSDDPVIGDDTVMRQVAVSATIGAGQSLAQSVQVTAPKTVGDSWIVVTADSDNAIRELLEDNNSRAASDPVQVAAAYTASVSTDVDEAPVNTPIAMTGTAVQAGGVLPAAHKLVNIHVVVRGARRVISVPTDSQGCFSTVFQPLPYEAGDYMIAAAHPGETAPAPQDAFSLFGMKIAPMEALRLPEGESASRVTGITNLGPVALSDLSATVVSSPPSMTVTASLSTNQLPGDSGLTLGIAATANEGSAPGGRAVIRVSSAEGAVADLELDIVADAPHPRLSTDPANLAAGMTRGGQTMVSFSLTNSGGAATGPLDILLPAAAWLRSASGATLPELAAGSNATVTLLLTPSADLALGPHTGSLVIRATNASVTVPFSFLCQSTAIGDLQLTAVDEYTYYADGSPNVSNAAVTITDPITETLVVSTNTGPGGRVTIKGLLEAPYKIEITDPDHGTFKQTLLLAAGRTNAVTAFLPRHAVRYYWTVEPSLAGDRTIITIETVFETDVPMPVVTIEPTIIDVADMVDDEMQVDIKFSNHGLVAAENTRLEFGELEGFTFVPLVDDLGHLAAQSSITVPVMIHRKVAPSNKSKKSAGEDTCSATYQGFWDVLCEAADKSYSTPGFAVDSGGNCGGGGEGAFGMPSDNGEEADLQGPPIIGDEKGAPCPCNLKIAVAAMECIQSFSMPAVGSCVTGIKDCLIGAGDGVDCAVGIARCIAMNTPIVGEILDAISCIKALTSACNSTAPSKQFSSIRSSTSGIGITKLASQNRLELQLDRMMELLGPASNFYGGAEWFQYSNEALWQNWSEGLTLVMQEESDAGAWISPAEKAELMAQPMGDPISPEIVAQFVERWNRTREYYGQGIYTVQDVPPGWSVDFIERASWSDSAVRAEAVELEVNREGYNSLGEAFEDARRDLHAELAGDTGDSCAKIRLYLEQNAVIARDVFRANVLIENSTFSSLEEITMDLFVKNGKGEDVTALFGIKASALDGIIGGVEGGGSIRQESSGQAAWIITPTGDAAPTVPERYYVGGLFRYRQDGVAVTVPLAYAVIKVLPNPSLVLRYFHERDVFSDDPFTTNVEASVPFSLAVMVQNKGYGTARNMRINSAQPKIIENEKGLLIDFTILAAEVSGQPLEPSLAAAFGDVGPGDVKVGRWLLSSTLQGQFTEYKASFEHLDGLGDRRLSLIDEVTIHEMNHLVRADLDFEDGEPDFLVNDVVDVHDYPDTLWLSSGTNLPVLMVTNATVDAPPSAGHMAVQMTISRPAGWVYLRVPNPGADPYALRRALRPDASAVPSNNVWTTDRTFVGAGKRPVRENILHLLDYRAEEGPVTYTLEYEDRSAPPDVAAPTSAVAELPANSPEIFTVFWSGEDDSGGTGIAGFDVYVSDNGGPYARWVTGANAGGAVFSGSPDHSYAFYSVAFDRAGNRETPPAGPDATTAVTVLNASPVLTPLGDFAIDEGTLFTTVASATDTDAPPQTVTFGLTTHPSGATIGSGNGQIRWQTGEANGPGIQTFRVTATDNGIPNRTSSMCFTVTVSEVNSAPVLSSIPDLTAEAGQTLIVTNRGSDRDHPPQTLTYSLVSAPAGAQIGSGTGLIQWTPVAGQAGNQYDFAIRATDDGPGALSVTQSFKVLVPGRLKMGVGSTLVLAGQDGSVPLDALAGAGISRISAKIWAPTSILTNWALWSFGPHVGSAAMMPQAEGGMTLDLSMIEGRPLPESSRLATMGFHAAAGAESDIIRLVLYDVVAWQADGAPAPGPTSVDGRVVLIADQSILELERTNGTMSVNVYGKPGVDYWFETATNFTSGWQSSWLGPLTNGTRTIGSLPTTNQFLIYRAREQ